MARYSFFAFFVGVVLLGAKLPLYAATPESRDVNSSIKKIDSSDTDEAGDAENSKPVVIEDRSGLSEEELRNRAKEFDKEKKRLKIKDVVESINENGTVNVTKLVQEKSCLPEPKNGLDWIETKYGDWLVGHIRSMYEKELEFDSKEFGIYRFKFKDITQIKSSAPMQVNIDNVAIFKGIIRLKDDKISIISGDHTYTFNRDMIIAITSAKERELEKWVGDFSLNIDFRKGNIEQKNISFKGNLERRTPKSRFSMDYLGRFSTAGEQTTANDNRLNAKYDIFYTKKLFLTPAVAEYYDNELQNIDKQYTLGLGIGYMLYDEDKIKWDIAAGPAYLYTAYIASDSDKTHDEAFSFEAYTKYEYKFNRLNKLKINYQLTLTKKSSGHYKHHVDVTLENDIVKDKIFINTSFIWDYIDYPQPGSGTTPLKSDYQFIVGAGLRF